QGMLGSQWFVSKFVGRQDSLVGRIVADIDVDAIGRGGVSDVRGGGPAYGQGVAGAPLSQAYEQWLRGEFARGEQRLAPVFRTSSADPLAHASCTGDHWSFSRGGVPSIFVTTGSHADSRSVTDKPATVDYDKLERVTQFVGSLALAVANW